MGKINRNSLTLKVLSALGLFGSVQVLSVVCSVVRTKLVALWIGTAGVGVLGLYLSGLNLFKTIGSLNIATSTVPSIAKARGEDKAATAAIVERLGTLLGLLGAIAMAVLSPLLSKMSFGTCSYAWGFALLSPAVFLNTSADARTAVLQGYAELKHLGKGNLMGIAVATAISLPLVYYFRMHAIVPMIVVYSLCPLAFLLAGKPRFSLRRAVPAAAERARMLGFVRLGAAFSLAMATGICAEYIIRAWLNGISDLATVGLFQAGTVIIGSYLGMAFTAISMEFFPRVSTTIGSPLRTSAIMSHEIALISRIMLPVILLFMAADLIVVRILYSGEFDAVSPYLTWAAAGSLPRGAAWCMSYAILARGDSRTYLLTESASAVALLVMSFIGWHLWGLAGLGVAYCGQMAVFCLVVYAVFRRRLGLGLSPAVKRLLVAATAIAIAGAIGRVVLGWWAPLVLAGFVMAALYMRFHRSK